MEERIFTIDTAKTKFLASFGTQTLKTNWTNEQERKQPTRTM